MEDIRASEVAGFCVGGLLLVVALAVPKVDSFIANSQRSSLGICERCGGLKVVSCSKCKGLGKVNTRMFSLNNKVASKLGAGKEDSFAPCQNCGAKGCFNCPKCSRC
ncbi:uncharacterized protein LOC131079601 [Cryptomeria japonica]|uniref:uncharacterized protein LOC131079601 n=1 Tax=Cryptomeria japonica TaxID=3369 RepID=UPI0027DA64B4|nr:uncharacterized protein LOC131079601 [Cryptomeria japonica]XP_059067262.1 uncharacterized protein LOC131079601 [Cryptomeria japonica]XP_059067263.1 uncharacterized protein LOC131079601 [Cryptomeria japonica]